MTLQKLFQGIFNKKIVFVTGHTGFIGGWLSLWLYLLGAKVVGYSLPPPTTPSLFKSIQLNRYVTTITGDVRNKKHLSKSIDKHNPDFVIHLAAQPLVLISYKTPTETINTNVMGTLNMLESVRKTSSVKVCINFTSDKCYENRNIDHAYAETDPLGGFDPYSASKASSELLTSSYRNSFFDNTNLDGHKVRISSVRAGNVIGGGDWAENRIVPDCIRSLMANKKIPIRSPNSIRPWQHVLEPITGLLLLASRMWKEPSRYNGAWNFGPDDHIKVKNLVEFIINDWGHGSWFDKSDKMKKTNHEANVLKLNCTKAKRSLGWKPIYPIREGISETIEWYKRYALKKFEMRDFTKQQIENYVESARHLNLFWTK